jgi:hypothetical protein
MTPEEQFKDIVLAQSAPVKIALLKGAIYSENADLWSALSTHRPHIEEYFSQVGVAIELNEADGYAFLAGVGEEHPAFNLPKIFRRNQYTFEITVVGAVIREELLQREASRLEDAAVVVSMDEIVDLIEVFLKVKADAAKERGRWETAVRAFARMGFLKPLSGDEEKFAVRPIVRAKFNIETLQALKSELQKYAAKSSSSS